MDNSILKIFLTWPAITALLLAIGSTIFFFFKAFQQGLMKHYTSNSESTFLFLKATTLSLLVNIVLLYVSYQLLETKLYATIGTFDSSINELRAGLEYEEFKGEFLDHGYKIISENYFVSNDELDLTQCQDKKSIKYFDYIYDEAEKDNADIVICK